MRLCREYNSSVESQQISNHSSSVGLDVRLSFDRVRRIVIVNEAHLTISAESDSPPLITITLKPTADLWRATITLGTHRYSETLSRFEFNRFIIPTLRATNRPPSAYQRSKRPRHQAHTGLKPLLRTVRQGFRCLVSGVSRSASESDAWR
ncbi:MAG: hypothetical protein EI684_15500 [Candidatus Viridilinea halotolerans]|uniref:Uncharacterized protein n=1 Tax=Candidatus Viridilinea halotolerans TaxID=2491704 RepID=A0A426TVS1_9CHLR|nr:MAG: hypothetical protein EI684_15500 [Candidatus Viridilinea halotolerans]